MPATPETTRSDGTGPPGTDHQDGTGGLTSALSTAVVHLLREHTGRGPTRAKTYINQDLLTVVLQDTLTKGERNLVLAGRASDVLHTRHIFQQTMRVDLVEAVQRLTGRKVAAFLSANHIEPDLAIESFMLEPEESAA
jgi:uncharacterized protein YbcI